MTASVHRPEAGDHEGDVGLNEHTFDGDLKGDPKWLRFGCRRKPGMECAIALRPHQTQTGEPGAASWAWDGNREAPTIKPSVNCEKVQHCGWHGWIMAGEWKP